MSDVQNFDALDLWDAVLQGSMQRVECLLAAGVDPNARFDGSSSPLSIVEEDWASADKSAYPPVIYLDCNEVPALRCVGECASRDKATLARIMNALLQYGADPYALFRQRSVSSAASLLCFQGMRRMLTTTMKMWTSGRR